MIQWLRDNLGIIEENKDSETLARVVRRRPLITRFLIMWSYLTPVGLS